MKQLIFLFLGVAALITAIGLYSKTKLPVNVPYFAPIKKEISIGSAEISVDVADSEPERKKGLGGRNVLGKNSGMLFVFPQKSSGVAFWMKDMAFPIDIIWINDSKIVKIDKNVQPQPGVSDSELKRYLPETEINYVLEVAGGFSDKNMVTTGGDVAISD